MMTLALAVMYVMTVEAIGPREQDYLYLRKFGFDSFQACMDDLEKGRRHAPLVGITITSASCDVERKGERNG